jgi:predicted amidohydrolase YtcJ
MIQILFNGCVHTLDSKRPRASAIAIDQGIILAVGEDEEIRSRYAGAADTLDLGGRPVIPGLTDAHIHLQQYALGLRKVDCETDSKVECLQRVTQRAREIPPGEWILGHGWNQNNWAKGFGSADELDAAAPDHPVYLTAKSLHAGWANHAALELAGIRGDSNDLPGGKIGRDASGNPDGILFEKAMELIKPALPEPSTVALANALRDAQIELAKMGLTGLHDFDRRDCFVALQALHQSGELKMRVNKGIPLEDLHHAAAMGLRTGFGDDMLRIGQVKLFADGALGPHTAAMVQPFEDDPANRGILMLDAEQLLEYGREAVASGLSLAVHAIGDRANHEVLNAFAQIRQEEHKLRQEKASASESHLPGELDLRHRIEHVQLIHPDDVNRLAELGIVASMQPIHATSDMQMADRFWGERSALAYAWRTQLDHGAVLAFGSDAPVESPNPFWGLHAAITRRRADGSPGPDGWYSSQRLSLGSALLAYTYGAAYAASMEDRLGKLAAGFLADLVVLDRDPFEVDPDALRETQAVATMVAGEWLWME